MAGEVMYKRQSVTHSLGDQKFANTMYTKSRASGRDLKLKSAPSTVTKLDQSNSTNNRDGRQKVRIIENDKDDKEKITPRDLLARIPAAGLYNFLYAKKKTERRIWAAILLITAGITLRYFVPTLTAFLEFKTAVDVSYVYDPSIPFPEVYVGIGGGFNRTYFYEKFRKFKRAEQVLMNDSRYEYWRKHLKAKDFYTLFDWVIGYVCSDPHAIGDDAQWLTNDYQKSLNEVIYRIILALGDDWPGLKTFYDESTLKCEKIFNHCEFNGEAFACCPDDRSFSFSISSRAYYFINITQNSTPRGIKLVTADLPYLSFSTRVNESDSVYYSTDFGIHIGNDAKGLFAVVTNIPVDMKSFFVVKTKKRKLLNKCYKQYQYDHANHYGSHYLLQRYFKEMESPGQYTVMNCMTAKLLEEFSRQCGCVPYYDSIKPNDTDICTQAHLYVCFHLAFTQLEKNVSSIDGVSNSVINVLDSLRERTSECLPLCDTWDYEYQVTHSPLAQASPEGIISNQAIIAMEPEYRSEVDVLKIDLIAFFASIGDGLGLFLGLSIVSFVQAPLWIVAAILLARNERRIASDQGDPSDVRQLNSDVRTVMWC